MCLSVCVSCLCFSLFLLLVIFFPCKKGFVFSSPTKRPTNITSVLGGYAFGAGSQCTLKQTTGSLAPCGTEFNIVQCLAASALKAAAMMLEAAGYPSIIAKLIELAPNLVNIDYKLVTGEENSLHGRFSVMHANFNAGALNRLPDYFDFFLLVKDRSRRICVSPGSVAGVAPSAATA